MKKVKIIIIIFIIINIIITFKLLSGKSNNKDKQTNENNTNSSVESNSEDFNYPNEYNEIIKTTYYDNKVLPQNCYKLSMDYSGEIELTDLYEKLNLLVNKLIPEIDSIKNNTTEIDRYYNENYDYIINTVGLYNSQYFYDLVNILISNNISKYLYSKYDEATYKNEEDESSFIIEIYYESENYIKVEVILDNVDNKVKLMPIGG